MVKKKTKQTILIVIVIAFVVFGSLIGTLLMMKALIPKTPEPAVSPETSDVSQKETSQTETAPATEIAPSETTLSPSQVNTIDIAPLGITVSYKKGTGPFEYEVLKTKSGTKYVEFRSEDLIGTKCTDDMGAFASILVNPSTEEMATVSKQVTLEGDVYGLSLASPACTSDADLLQEYQTSFSDAFGLLKKM